MPSYRPKSLDELNNMYDKKLAAENALKKGSSHLKPEIKAPDNKPPAYEPYTYEDSKFKKEAPAAVNDISGAVNEFIRTFGQTQQKKPAKVQNVHPIQTTVKSTKIASKAPGKPAAPVSTQKKKAPAQNAKKQERTVLVRNDERSDLMDDYKKIMMDEDEDSMSIKERLAMKKKSKAEKKESQKAAKKEHKNKKDAKASKKDHREKEVHPVQTVSQPMPSPAAEATTKAEDTQDSLANRDFEEIAVVAQNFINENITPDSPDEDYVPEHLMESSRAYDEDEAQVEPSDDETDYPEEATDDACAYNEEYTAEEEAYENQQAAEEEAEEEYSAEADDEQDIFESFASTPTAKAKGGAGRVISLLALVVVLVLTASVGALKYVVCVDTGKGFLNHYVFTAKEQFVYAGIETGDLVISENKQINSSDAFVYYDNTSFRFAKPSDISSANSYVIIAENDSEQVLASTDNVRGVVKLSIPVAGKIVGLAMDNFLIVFAVMTGLCLILIILTAILFAKGRKRQEELLYALEDEEYDDYSSEDTEEENEAYEQPYDTQDEEASNEYSDESYVQSEEEYYDEEALTEEVTEQPELSQQAEGDIPGQHIPFYELADEE